jgi:hypothetical protein
MKLQAQLKSLAYLLVMLTAVGNAWGDRQITRDDSSNDSPQRVNNMDSWGEEEQTNDSWTWFGMGYESRIPGSESIAATGIRKIAK